jgi:hypothetical protein
LTQCVDTTEVERFESPIGWKHIRCKNSAIQFLQTIDFKGKVRAVAYCNNHSLNLSRNSHIWAGWEQISQEEYMVYQTMTE